MTLHGFSDLLAPMDVFAPVLNANSTSRADDHDRFELGLTAFANHSDATLGPNGFYGIIGARRKLSTAQQPVFDS